MTKRWHVCSMDQSDTQTPHGDELKIWQKSYIVILSSHLWRDKETASKSYLYFRYLHFLCFTFYLKSMVIRICWSGTIHWKSSQPFILKLLSYIFNTRKGELISLAHIFVAVSFFISISIKKKKTLWVPLDNINFPYDILTLHTKS